MGKGMKPKAGYNQQAYETNYDSIDWSSTRKNYDNNKTVNKSSVQEETQKETK